MQLYACNYFFFMYEALTRASEEEKKKSILHESHKLPGLALDAASDDMLKKIVYSLASEHIRSRMIKEYYQYKKVFVPPCTDRDLTSEKIALITEALRKYCVSLVDVSIEYGVEKFESTLLDPYGVPMSLQEIRKKFTNGESKGR
jgi:hypothetical protein